MARILLLFIVVFISYSPFNCPRDSAGENCTSYIPAGPALAAPFGCEASKSPGLKNPGPNIHASISYAFFSHPDYTVGTGISPVQPPKRVADFSFSTWKVYRRLGILAYETRTFH